MTKPEKVSAWARSAPGDAGKTGLWRTQRPVVDPAKCIPIKKGNNACYICWLVCPDGVISRGKGPEIDLEYCKGCGICAEECPVAAIELIDEEEP